MRVTTRLIASLRIHETCGHLAFLNWTSEHRMKNIVVFVGAIGINRTDWVNLLPCLKCHPIGELCRQEARNRFAVTPLPSPNYPSFLPLHSKFEMSYRDCSRTELARFRHACSSDCRWFSPRPLPPDHCGAFSLQPFTGDLRLKATERD